MLEFLLAVLYLLFGVPHAISILDLDGEMNLPTWFSSGQLFLLAALLFVISRRESARHRPIVARAVGMLSLTFAFFSLDEVATIHERINANLEKYAAVPRFAGVGIWIFVYGALAVVILAIVAPGLWQYARANRSRALRFCMGAVIYLTGAVGLEILFYEHVFVGSLEVLVEECMEMGGVSVMIWACLLDLQTTPVEIHTASLPSRLPSN